MEQNLNYELTKNLVFHFNFIPAVVPWFYKGACHLRPYVVHALLNLSSMICLLQ